MSQLKYYVYAYLRNTDSTTAKAGTPYYIGKGCGNRAYKPHGKVKVPIDKKFIIFLELNLSNIGSQAIERRMIRWYGKKSENGIILNIQDGGEGSECSESTKQKLREINTGKKQSQATIDKRRLSKTGQKDSEEVKLKKSVTKIGSKNPMYGKTGDKHHNFGKTGLSKGKKRSEETKLKMKESSGTIGKTSVIDVRTGTSFSINTNDPRFTSGEVVGHRRKQVLAKFITNDYQFLVDVRDPRFLTGELEFIPVKRDSKI